MPRPSRPRSPCGCRRRLLSGGGLACGDRVGQHSGGADAGIGPALRDGCFRLSWSRMLGGGRRIILGDAGSMVMSGQGSVYKRCGCVDLVTCRQLGGRCPRLAGSGRGSWYIELGLPAGPDGRRCRIRRGLPVPGGSDSGAGRARAATAQRLGLDSADPVEIIGREQDEPGRLCVYVDRAPYPSSCPGVTDGLGARWRRPMIAKRRRVGEPLHLPRSRPRRPGQASSAAGCRALYAPERGAHSGVPGLL
jgi:hypothetical protein